MFGDSMKFLNKFLGPASSDAEVEGLLVRWGRWLGAFGTGNL